MFDLAFFKIVIKVLMWTADAPGLDVVNFSQARMWRNREKREDHRMKKLFLAEEMELREYVYSTYIDYFGLTWRIGAFQENLGKILFCD